MLKKAICIKDTVFDYSIDFLEVRKGEEYYYYKDNFGYNVRDKKSETLYYPILGFNKYFKDLAELRKEKIEKLFNDTCNRK